MYSDPGPVRLSSAGSFLFLVLGSYLFPSQPFYSVVLKTNTVCTLAMFQPFVKHTRRLIRGIPAYSLLFSRGEHSSKRQ